MQGLMFHNRVQSNCNLAKLTVIGFFVERRGRLELIMMICKSFKMVLESCLNGETIKLWHEWCNLGILVVFKGDLED